MKKIISVILTIVLTFTIIDTYTNTHTYIVYADNDTSAEWPSAPGIYGTSAVLIEASTGTVLYSKKADKQMYPASITKIMTALLTIENCKLDETVVFSEDAVNCLQYGDANFGCQVGEKMSVKDCLYVLMLKSANEVANALGEHIAGSSKKFADMMTERAKKAGAKNTHFANASGLHNPKHYITAYDMAMITRDAAKYDLFNEVVNTTSYKVSKNNKRKTEDIATQRHQMVNPYSAYYYDGIIGGKTGYTDQSGTTLVTYAKRNGMTLIAVVLNSNGVNVYKDTTVLLDYGFNNFKLFNVSKNDNRFSEDSTLNLKPPFETSSDSVYIDKSSNVVLPKTSDFSKLSSDVNFKLSEDSFGTITYKLNKKTVGTADLKYKTTSFSEISTVKTSETKDAADTSANKSTVSAEKEKTSSPKHKAGFKFKLTKHLITIIIIFVIIIIFIILIILQKRKLNRIRENKRHRHY